MEGVTGLAGGGEAREVIVGGLPGRRTASWGSSSSHVARRRGWRPWREGGRGRSGVYAAHFDRLNLTDSTVQYSTYARTNTFFSIKNDFFSVKK
jgi:hypothetical protein